MIRHACLLMVCMLSAVAHAQTAAEEQDLTLAFGDSATISVASGASQQLRRAPAVASVFSAEDIRASGATDLTQVLELVPGLHVARSFYFYEPKYQVRGLQHDFSPQILVLIDGVRRQSADTGGAEELWVSMPVDHIERVEVIRGPGSALYGADAFAGVISITTKSPAELRGTRASLLAGSYRERALSLQHGGTQGELGWSAWLRLGRTAGPNEAIEVDAQTGLDALFGSHASLAPGGLDMRHRAVDAALRLDWQDWRLQASLKRRSDIGLAEGIAQALSRGDWANTEHRQLSLAYQRAGIAPDLDLQLQAAIAHEAIDTLVMLFPPGAFGGAYPEGMLGAPGRSTRHGHLAATLSYGGFSAHQLRIGAGSQLIDMYRVTERKNFNFVHVPGVGNVPVPLGGLIDVSDELRYMAPHTRRVNYLLVQDEWSIARDWTLTAGLRHDRFSDFGATTKPRVALVWDAAYNLTAKLLHGRAFRAPTFSDLYTINNPINQGNPNLRPETLTSNEFALDWQPSPMLHAVLNLYRLSTQDMLTLLPNADPSTGATAANRGSLSGRGIEAELRWQAARGLRLQASFAQQRLVDAAGVTAGDAPRRMLKAGVDWRIAADWSLNGQARHIGGRARAPGDTRPPLSDYTLVDLALQWRRGAQSGWSLLLGLHNALDADAREPSPAPGSIPNDFPLPRRNWVLQAGYGF